MKESETNDFIYKKWKDVSCLEQFKKDVGLSPSIQHILAKIDINKPFSPDNYKWVVKPKNNIPLRKQRNVYDAITLQLYIADGVNLDRAAVYKLTFDDDSFYIGSTKNLRRRVSCFVGTFRGTSKMHNKKMIQCVAKCDSAIVEIISYVEDISKLKILETEEISKFIGSPLLLNRAHDAHSNKGVVWTEEEKRKTKETLIEKYRLGIYKAPGSYRRNNPTKQPDQLFKSKYFGDKEN